MVNNGNGNSKNPVTDNDAPTGNNHDNINNEIINIALEEEGEETIAIVEDASTSNNNNKTSNNNNNNNETTTSSATSIATSNQNEENSNIMEKTRMEVSKMNDDTYMDHTETDTSTTDISVYSPHHYKISEIKVKDGVVSSSNNDTNKNDDVMLSLKQLERETNNTLLYNGKTKKKNTSSIRRILRGSETSNKDYNDIGSKSTLTGILRMPFNKNNVSTNNELIHDDLLDINRNNLHNDIDDENSLAVAVPVTDNGDEHLPAAIEMDPDEKNNLHNIRTNAAQMKKRSRLLFFGSLIFVFTLIGAIVGIVVSRQKNDNHTREQLNIPEYIISQLRTEDIDQLLNDPNSPYSKAMNWIIYQDPLQVTPYDSLNTGSNLFQRYILAYIYFATSVKRNWDWCAPLLLVNKTGATATSVDNNYYNLDLYGNKITCRLQTYKRVTLTPIVKESAALVNWLSTQNECKWAGVICDKQWNIITLDMSGFNMTGTFPEGVTYLQYLTEIYMSSGELEGTVPKADRLKNVEWFEARQNKFTGNMNETQGMRNLRVLYLQGNQLTGELPVDTNFWKDLKRLDVRGNNLVGQLPSAAVWEQAKSFSDLMVSENNFEGMVIPELFTANAESLEYIMVDTNNFSGTIPTEIGNCKELIAIFFGGNNFTGPIPEEIYTIDKLQFLSLEQNQLNGTISPSIGNATRLRSIRLEGNQLSGSIPTNFGNLESLENFNVDDNNLSGLIPIDLCQRYVIEVSADCLPDISGVGQVECPSGCCTKCCDAEGSNCKQMTTNGNK